MRLIFAAVLSFLVSLSIASPALAAEECARNAPVSVTAAATTEIVPAVAGRSIRICNMALTISATGTAKLVSGTGTNCGTGTADVTAAMAVLANSNVIVAGGGSNVLRLPSGKALCIAAVTGNVTGFVNYSIF